MGTSFMISSRRRPQRLNLRSCRFPSQLPVHFPLLYILMLHLICRLHQHVPILHLLQFIHSDKFPTSTSVQRRLCCCSPEHLAALSVREGTGLERGGCPERLFEDRAKNGEVDCYNSDEGLPHAPAVVLVECIEAYRRGSTIR